MEVSLLTTGRKLYKFKIFDKIMVKYNYSKESDKFYPAYCRWCGGKCKIIPAKEHWTKREQNKCQNCAIINNKI